MIPMLSKVCDGKPKKEIKIKICIIIIGLEHCAQKWKSSKKKSYWKPKEKKLRMRPASWDDICLKGWGQSHRMMPASQDKAGLTKWCQPHRSNITDNIYLLLGVVRKPVCPLHESHLLSLTVFCKRCTVYTNVLHNMEDI